jgi:serine protease
VAFFIDLRRNAARNRTIIMQNSKFLRSLFPALFAAALLAQLVACGGSREADDEPPITQPPAKQAPVAVIATSAQRGEAPFTVEFSGANSYDADGSIASYVWAFASGETATGSVVRRTFDLAGDYAVTLTVTDNAGLTSEETVTVTALAPGSRFRIGGVITSLPYTDVDGDVNDPFADYFDNDGHTSANFQPLSNPVLLNGFATATQTGQLPDAFAFEADLHDIYSVELAQGDFVSMQVVDYTGGDLDLLLFDGNSSTPVAASEGVGEFESVMAPESGSYLIMVNAVSRASRYLLKVGKSSFVAGPSAAGQSLDFEPDQAVFKRRGSFVRGLSLMEQAQMKVTHQGDKRAALAHLNPANPQTQAVLQLSANPSGFEKLLAQKNPDALAKLRTLKAIKRLRQQPDIEYAEPNYRLRSMLTPTDPTYIYQWHYGAINLPQAWNITTGSSDVIVAVVDSGVFSPHPDLQGQLVPGYDFISTTNTSNDGDGIDGDPTDPGDSIYVGSSSWHGTHVIGTVVAAMNNNEGGVGVAAGTKAMPLRAMGRGGGLSYDVLQAVRYAAGLENDSGTLPAQRADIINLSLGGGGYSQASQDLYRAVRTRGVIVIAAAGNDNTEEPMYPASYDGVVSVAASDFRGERAPYSNTGAFVDVTAPGGNMSVDRNNDGYSDGILSTGVQESGTAREKSYVFYQGTSMASPHVAGVAALMKSVHPDLTPDEFDSLIASGAITDDKGQPGRDDQYGYGLIDAYRAVEAARALASGGTTAALLASSSILVFEGDVVEQVVSMRTVGSGAISITEVHTTEPWLSAAPRQVDGNRIGSYTVTVDRGSLPDGVYRGFVEFTTDVGTVVKVQVNMRVGEFVPVGNAGFLYVLLIDANLGAVTMVGQSAAVEGQYAYYFDDVPIGDYYIAAGSDINNDTYVCELGESCGFYPSVGEETIVRVDGDKNDLNFPAGLTPSIGVESTDADRRGFSRELFHY